jgi:hypothetical protein
VFLEGILGDHLAEVVERREMVVYAVGFARARGTGCVRDREAEQGGVCGEEAFYEGGLAGAGGAGEDYGAGVGGGRSWCHPGGCGGGGRSDRGNLDCMEQPAAGDSLKVQLSLGKSGPGELEHAAVARCNQFAVCSFSCKSLRNSQLRVVWGRGAENLLIRLLNASRARRFFTLHPSVNRSSLLRPTCS